MAVLPATLMTFGNFASENEITAMKASGISLYRMMRPGLALALMLTCGMIFYNNQILPESNHRLLNLLIDINKKKPTVEIKENVFVDAFQGYNIYVRRKNDKTGEVRDVQIFESDEKGTLLKTITAEKGMLRYLEDDHILRFELENAEIHEIPRGSDPSAYRRTILKSYIMNIKDIDRTLKRSERSYRGDREMSARMMEDKIKEIRRDIAGVHAKMNEMARTQVREVLDLLDAKTREEALGTPPRPGAGDSREGPAEDSRARPIIQVRSPDAPRGAPDAPTTKLSTTIRALESQREINKSYFKQIDRYRVEIHKKYSIPFACIIFVLIGSPIAIRLGRSGMNTAIGLTIFVFLVYYVCLIGGEKLADRQILSPVVAMWVPNVIFGAAAAFLIRSATLEQSVVQFRLFGRLSLRRRD
jgi:lipopolysaccharide export system permease protein